MRTLLKATLEVEAASKAILDGTLPKILDKLMATIKPEAAYFTAMGGERCMLLFFDLKEPYMIPVIAEQLFIPLKAKIEMIPVMNAEDVTKGLTAFMALK